MSGDRVLRVWDAADGPDTVIAYDEADASSILREYLGYSESEAACNWRPLDADEVFSFFDDRPAEREHVRITAGEACAKYGRGHLCSTEY